MPTDESNSERDEPPPSSDAQAGPLPLFNLSPETRQTPQPTSPLWLAERARINPDTTALRFHGEDISYAQLHERAQARAMQLRKLGLKDGDALGLLLDNGPLFAELVHAAAMCHAILLPINTRLTASEVAHPLEDAKVGLLVHGSGLLADLAKESIAKLPAEKRSSLKAVSEASDDTLQFSNPTPTEAVPVADQRPLHNQIREEDVLAILYTSGTSGKPKGVILTYGCFHASARGSIKILGDAPNECWLLCMPLFHIAGLSILIRSVLTGKSVLLHDRFDAQAVSIALDTERVTLVSLVPTMFLRLLEARGEADAPHTLRGVLLGGGPISETLLNLAHDLDFPVHPTYGLTEACSQVVTRPIKEGEDTRRYDRGPKPLPGVKVRIVDDGDRELAVGESGEIVVQGPILMKGYLNQPEETQRTLRGGWLHTGDIGVFNSEGSLRVLDRRNDLIVSGGENVYPAEVEAAVISHPEVHEVGVTAEIDDEFGQRVVAYVVREPGTRISKEQVQAHCREQLASYKTPRRVYFIDRLPRNASGKMLRRLLGEDPSLVNAIR
jgi:O-succinylbenzoic acid--CoA ligase